MENSSDLRSTFIDCSEPSRLSPIRCNKVAYLMIIEYFGHFSIKHKLAEDIREQVEMAIKPSAVMFYRK